MLDTNALIAENANLARQLAEMQAKYSELGSVFGVSDITKERDDLRDEISNLANQIALLVDGPMEAVQIVEEIQSAVEAIAVKHGL